MTPSDSERALQDYVTESDAAALPPRGWDLLGGGPGFARVFSTHDATSCPLKVA